MSDLAETLLQQLDAALASYHELRGRSQYDDLSDMSHADHHRVIALGRAAVNRIAGPGSPYATQIQEIIDRSGTHDGRRVSMVAGVVESLRTDVAAGYVQSVSELLHAEVFADFLEMADHLLQQGYKDAAAVLAGSSLEAHLRQLCTKFNVAVAVSGSSGVKPKKADQMNADLAAVPAYNKLEQKNVTAWLDLRNKAAHGNYADYDDQQVALLIQGVRDFLTRNPA